MNAPWVVVYQCLVSQAPAAAGNFVDSKSILALGGAAVAVVAVSNTLGQVFKVPRLMSAFVVSILIAYIRLVIDPPAPPTVAWVEWILAFFNGCILFCTAAGINEPISGGGGGGGGANPPAAMPTTVSQKQPFFRSWF